MNNCYSGNIGNVLLSFRFRYPETIQYFDGWLKREENCNEPVYVPQEDFDYFAKTWNIPCIPYSEYSLSVYRACDRLLKHKRCIFHGAAFLWKDKAYVFTAKSGTGKSTQLSHWMNLYGDEVQIMNGDKPVFVLNQEGITVMPSPWKGKEGLGNDSLSAPLGGIILLEQGKTNSIQKIYPQQSVPRLLQRILFTADTKEHVLSAAEIIEGIVTSVPVWNLINTGDTESAEMTYEALRKELESK